MSTETSILLPTAKVDLFLRDGKTIEAAKALQNDWRFARVSVRVHEGDVEDAIKLYASSPSPEILMVETDSTEQVFINRLGELSGSCEENTSAIVIGPVNDVNLYRSLTAMGVSDYLVRPVPLDTLSELIAQTLIKKLGTAGSRLISVVGSKGGVGVSSVSQILSYLSSENLSQKTLLLDAAGAWSSHGVSMGFEPVASTAEAIKAVVGKDADSLRRMLYQVNDKLSVLATGLEPMLETAATITQFEEILNNVMTNYPVVIVDLSGAPHALKKSLLTRSHEIMVVATPTLSSLRAARSLIGEIKKIQGGKGDHIDLIVNMVGMAPGKEVPKSDIKAALDFEPEAFIPFDTKVFIGAENEGRKISSDKAGQDIAVKLLPLLQKIIGGGDTSAPDNDNQDGLIGSLMSKLKTKK